MWRAMSTSCLISRNLTWEKTIVHPNHSERTFTEKLLALLKLCVSTKMLQQIHTQMLINSIHKPNFLLSKLIGLKDFNYSFLFFSRILEPNDYAFNIMVRGLTTTWKKFDLALKLYYQMKFSGLKPNNFTYPFLFIACANLLASEHGRMGHAMIFKDGLNVDSHVNNSLITMYSRCGELVCARKVFDEIPKRDLVSWNSMISGYFKMGFAGEAVAMFEKMRDEGFEPDDMTVASVLGACGDLGDLNLGRWLEGFVLNGQVEVNSYVVSALIDMYAKCGELLSARRVFDMMKGKNVVIWNAMITGYAQNGLSDETIMLFNAMKVAEVKPDRITLIAVLSACASTGALDIGKSVNTYASESGLRYDIYVATALIDMYAKCGCMDQALRIFEGMPQKNEVSWNAMISALAFHGRAREALLLFKRMLEDDGPTCPDDITFVAALSACVHAGLVDEGLWLFNLITSFKLVPKVEHYSCMVDLLARAGQLHEAWDFIEKMPGKPDEATLGALLFACQKVGNEDVFEKVMQLLIELEPSNSGNYVISSQVYAKLKRWDDSARMRLLMRQKGVAKTPGCSWMEIDSQLHTFHAGASPHLCSEEIYKVMKLLYDEMKMKEHDML